MPIIEEKHKELLRSVGVRDEEFDLFEDRNLKYEFDPRKGVRLYDPLHQTSTTRYVGIDGWTSWSGEEDDFMEVLFPKGPPQKSEAAVEGSGKEALKKLKRDAETKKQ